MLSTLAFLSYLSSIAAEDLYDYSTSSVTKLDPSNFQSLVVDSAETWLVEFYAPWCGHCRNLAPAWNKAAKRLRGVARVGAVNCDEHQSLAQQYGIQGFPTIKVFKGLGTKARRPDDYQGARTAGAIVSYAKSVMPSLVASVKRSGLEAFFNDEKKLPHVLLFTDKKQTSPLYKGLSATFSGKLALGEVKKGDAGDLLKTYGITSFPSIVSFKANASPSDEATPYTGTMDPDSLTAFLNTVAGDAPPSSGDGAKGTGKQSEPVFKQPDAFDEAIQLLKSSKAYKELCGARPDKRMCGLSFLPKGEDHSLFASLKSIAEQFKFDNLAIVAIDSASEYGGLLSKAFQIDSSKGGFVVIRSGKPKYSMMPEEREVSADNVRAFLDKVVSGNVRYKKLENDLPKWEPAKEVNAEGERKDAAGKDPETKKSDNKTSGEAQQKEEVCGANSSDGSAKCGAKDEL